MPDMLVKLYTLPPLDDSLRACAAAGITIRRPLPYEKTRVLDFVRREFSVWWADETEVAFAMQPVNCFIATEQGAVIGFSVQDVSARGFFGPIGVRESHRQRGIGKALFLASLHALWDMGFAYAIIGQIDGKARAFYEETVGAVVIPDSEPGVYRDPLRRP